MTLHDATSGKIHHVPPDTQSSDLAAHEQNFKMKPKLRSALTLPGESFQFISMEIWYSI